MELIPTNSTIEITIVENPYVHIQNTKFPTREKDSFTEFNLDITLSSILDSEHIPCPEMTEIPSF